MYTDTSVLSLDLLIVGVVLLVKTATTMATILFVQEKVLHVALL